MQQSTNWIQVSRAKTGLNCLVNSTEITLYPNLTLTKIQKKTHQNSLDYHNHFWYGQNRPLLMPNHCQSSSCLMSHSSCQSCCKSPLYCIPCLQTDICVQSLSGVQPSSNGGWLAEPHWMRWFRSLTEVAVRAVKRGHCSVDTWPTYHQKLVAKGGYSNEDTEKQLAVMLPSIVLELLMLVMSHKLYICVQNKCIIAVY